eukprot:SAG11_NODE_27_length_23309_cov_10.579362_10_plen_80_part_00
MDGPHVHCDHELYITSSLKIVDEGRSCLDNTLVDRHQAHHLGGSKLRMAERQLREAWCPLSGELCEIGGVEADWAVVAA